MTPKEFFKNKKVLVMGLGLFGGGAATAKWLDKNGACVTVTDLRKESELNRSMLSFSRKQRDEITFVLGHHRKTDFKTNDMIVVNPGVPDESPFLNIARKLGKDLQNDASLFFRFTNSSTIAVTGTRGKTTTTNWISQILSHKFGKMEPIGNSPQRSLLNELAKEPMYEVEPRTLKKVYVAELSSWQLELLYRSKRAPHIAIITNLYPDHLNRHKNMDEYADAKANIFIHQDTSDFLILNYDNKWKKFFLNKKPKAQLNFFSTKQLPKKINGIFINNGKIVSQKDGVRKDLLAIHDFEKKWGHHNLENLLASMLAVMLHDPKMRITQKIIRSLTEIPLRQETVHKSKYLTVINDSASTSPNALISALRRFGKYPNTVFICGGTSKKLPFDEAAKVIKQTVCSKNLILLSGSATNDLLAELMKINYFDKKPQIFETLDNCVLRAFEMIGETPCTIIFSPGGSSFEKFKNEFDRGKQFNEIIQRILQQSISSSS